MERYFFDVMTNTLEMSAGFARASADVRSPEYKLYLPEAKLLQKKLREWIAEEENK